MVRLDFQIVGNYKVFSDGRVYSIGRIVELGRGIKRYQRGRWLKIDMTRDYPRVSMNGKMKYVHRIVAETFIPTIDKGLEVNHIDGDKTNNCVSNLEWITHQKNMKHAFDTGLFASNEKHYRAKLTNKQVSSLRKEYASGGITQKKLANKYGMTQSSISRIVLLKGRKLL